MGTRSVSIVVLGLSVCLLAASQAHGESYYVDFEGGSDSAEGTSPATAFKHCPGDRGAQDSAKAAALAPGDTVIFKGGVRYRGSIDVTWAGEQDKPVTYDGNTAGTFGKGRAIIDGSEALADWQPCESAEACGGNPNWQKLYYAHIPRTPMYRVCLYEGDEFLALARDPNVPDAFWPEDLKTLRPRVDPDPFTETDVAVEGAKALRVNPGRPLVYMLDGNGHTSAILDPLVGAALTFAPQKAATITAVGIANCLQAGYAVAKEVSVAADGKEVLKATLRKEAVLQRFDLPSPITFRKLTVKVLSSYPDKLDLGAVAEVQAFDADEQNVLLARARTAYVDATYFTQTDPHAWDGAFFLVPASGHLSKQRVVGYDPEEHKIIVQHLTGSVYRRATHARYCTFGMLNALGVLDAPGEFHFDETPGAKGMHRVTLWPRDPGTNGPREVSFAARYYAFDLRSEGHVVIQGFRIQKLGGAGGDAFAVSNHRVKTGRDIVIRDNEILRIGAGRRSIVIQLTGVEGALVEGNTISLNRYCTAVMASGCSGVVTSNNRLHKNGATAIDYYGCRSSKLLHNTLTDHKGVHANGLTLYNGNKDCLVEGNRVSGGNNGMTIQGAENVVIRNNIFDGHGEAVSLAIWPQRPFRNVKVLHNVFLRTRRESTYSASLFSNSRCIEGLVVKNNIMDGYALEHYADKLPGEFSHNLYTYIGPTDHKARGLGEGDVFEPDLKKIFVDPEHDDYRLRPGSPAIDAGTDAGVDHDIHGTPVPQGKAPDIGAYEFSAK